MRRAGVLGRTRSGTRTGVPAANASPDTRSDPKAGLRLAAGVTPARRQFRNSCAATLGREAVAKLWAATGGRGSLIVGGGVNRRPAVVSDRGGGELVAVEFGEVVGCH
jgi:hypothetical protein